MKTRTALFVVLILGATLMPGLFSNSLPGSAPANVSISNKSTSPATPGFFETCLGRYTSFFRSFMPFDEDPCNHLPTRKSYC